jgi:hypothetical protein
MKNGNGLSFLPYRDLSCKDCHENERILKTVLCPSPLSSLIYLGKNGFLGQWDPMILGFLIDEKHNLWLFEWSVFFW